MDFLSGRDVDPWQIHQRRRNDQMAREGYDESRENSAMSDNNSQSSRRSRDSRRGRGSVPKRFEAPPSGQHNYVARDPPHQPHPANDQADEDARQVHAGNGGPVFNGGSRGNRGRGGGKGGKGRGRGDYNQQQDDQRRSSQEDQRRQDVGRRRGENEQEGDNQGRNHNRQTGQRQEQDQEPQRRGQNDRQQSGRGQDPERDMYELVRNMQGLVVRNNEWRRSVAKSRNFVLIIPPDSRDLRTSLFEAREIWDNYPQGKGADRRPPIYMLHWAVITSFIINISANKFAGHVPLSNLATFLQTTIAEKTAHVRSFKSFGRRPGRIPNGDWMWSLEWDDMLPASRHTAENCLLHEDGWVKAGLEFRRDYVPMDNAERAVYNASI
jgi:hypothetical protein